jgi:hypothetical protein
MVDVLVLFIVIVAGYGVSVPAFYKKPDYRALFVNKNYVSSDKRSLV